MAGQILHPRDFTAVLETCTEALLSPSSPMAFNNPLNLPSAASLAHKGLHQRWGRGMQGQKTRQQVDIAQNFQ